ncbi:MAG: FdtA/QdtA family cupin domain-containing protein [Bacteroidaceae bacterium]|nr:FdtA/QdtA family cupin domain-containing protein [Bacteroidaceae bacterium]
MRDIASFSGSKSGSDASAEVWPSGVVMVELPDMLDERGRLNFLQGGLDVPWEIKRVFWITDVPDGQTRGGHSHRTCHEAVFPVAGSFDITVSDGVHEVRVRMDDARFGIVIPAGIWCNLEHFAPGTVCLAVASEEYDASGYINDFDEFLGSRA